MYKKKNAENGGSYHPPAKYEDRKGPPRRRTPPPPRAPKENIKVTAETEVPPMPEKHQILNKPNWETQYKAEYDAFENEIRKVKNEKVRRSP